MKQWNDYGIPYLVGTEVVMPDIAIVPMLSKRYSLRSNMKKSLYRENTQRLTKSFNNE